MHFCCLIPARSGSKRIVDKNIIDFAGKPLILHSLQQATKCKNIKKVFIFTDCDKIKEIVNQNKNRKIIVVDRDKKNCQDESTTESAIKEFCEKFPEQENIVLLQCTNPFVKQQDLTQAIEKYISLEYDSLLSVVEQKKFLWKGNCTGINPVNYNPHNRPRSQEYQESIYVENGSFYIFTRKGFLDNHCRLYGRIGFHCMSRKSYFEIDDHHDLSICKKLFTGV